MPAHVDLPRLTQGKNGGAFWSAYVPCPKNGLDFEDANYADCKTSLCYWSCEVLMSSLSLSLSLCLSVSLSLFSLFSLFVWLFSTYASRDITLLNIKCERSGHPIKNSGQYPT
jgi:hypothetical protein